MTTIKASELEAGDTIVRDGHISGTYTITLSYAGTRMQTTGAENTPVGLVVDWEGTSQYGTPRIGIFAADELITVIGR